MPWAAGPREVIAQLAAWRDAVAILDRLPHSLADEIRARLRALGADASGGGGSQLTGAATAAR